jgi:ribonuclease HI
MKTINQSAESPISSEPAETAQELYLLDGSSYIYRAYYGYRDFATAAGMPTNAVFGFTKMLLNLLQENQPDYLAVIFDPPREETFRRELYPEYKANRDAMPEDLTDQIQYIRKILQALNISTMKVAGFEADDVIATLAQRYASDEIKVTVVTGDKDLMQIVNQKTTLLDTMKDKRSGPQEVLERFGVPAERVPDVLGLAGDTSDNIPGVPGVGEKTAAELVRRFGSLDDVLKWKHLVSGKKRKENLQHYAEQARLSKTLATVRYDVELDVSLEDLARQEPNLTTLMPLLRELEFEALEIAFTAPAPGVVELYSDGSGTDSGPGGFGVVLRYAGHEKELSGYEPEATSQRMELIAAIKGLEALNNRSKVHVFSDSQYLVQGMSKWIHNWTRNGRLEEPGALANQDLWKQLETLSHQHEISWEWVRGHSGHPFNERCDKLAKRAVEVGIGTTEEAHSPEKAVASQEAVAEPLPPVKQEPVPVREESEFVTDEDGQLRLC